MNIKLGTQDVSAIYHGAIQVDSILIGSEPISGGIDADAQAYADAITIAGATLKEGDLEAISSFIKGEKSSGRWDKAVRIHMPIWSFAAPNAICMKSLAVGTFGGSVNHTYAPFIARPSAGGYFQFDITADQTGLTNEDFSFWHATNVAPTTGNAMFIGCIQGAITVMNANYATTGLRFGRFSAGRNTSAAWNMSEVIGVFFSSREGGSDYAIRRSPGATATIYDTPIAADGDIPTIPFYAMSLNNEGAPLASASQSSFYGYGFGLSYTKAEASAFAESLQDLWTSISGSPLP